MSFGLAISIWEVMLIIWVLNILLDEIVKILMFEKRITLYKRLISYLSLSSWDEVTFSAIVVFIVGMILRFIPDQKCFKAAKYI
jgi:hypothetical protein